MIKRGGDSLFNLLSLNNTLTLLPVDGLLLLLQTEQGVNTRHETAGQTRGPGTVSVLLELLDRSQLAVADHVDDGDGVEGEVARVAELATDGQVAENRVDGALVVEGQRGGLQVLEELADTQDLAGGAELLLDGVVGVDGGLRLVGAVQVPGVEAGEVLDGAQKLVAADWWLGRMSISLGLMVEWSVGV